MRVVPVPAENGPEGGHWELLSARHRRELNMGSTQSRAPRSPSRVVLSAVRHRRYRRAGRNLPLPARLALPHPRRCPWPLRPRQLASFPLNGEEQFYVEGTLPEIAEEEEAAATTLAEAAQLDASVDAGLEQNEPSFAEASAGLQPRRASPRSGPASPTVRAVASPRAKNTKANVRNAAKADSAARSEAGIEHSEQDQRVPREPLGHHGQTSSVAAVPVLHRNVQIVRIARIAPVASHAVALPVGILPGAGSASPPAASNGEAVSGKTGRPGPQAEASGATDRPAIAHPAPAKAQGAPLPAAVPPSARAARPQVRRASLTSLPWSCRRRTKLFRPNRPSGAGRPSGPGAPWPRPRLGSRSPFPQAVGRSSRRRPAPLR